jgi:hypothetical protein
LIFQQRSSPLYDNFNDLNLIIIGGMSNIFKLYETQSTINL